MVRWWAVAGAAAAVCLPPVGSAPAGAVLAGAAAKGPVRVTPPFVWARDLGAEPRIPLVGDLDGDGFADLVSVWPKGACWVDVAFNAGGVKSQPPRRVLSGFGQDCVDARLAELDGKPGLELAVLFADGTARVASDFPSRRPQVRTEPKGRELFARLGSSPACPDALLGSEADLRNLVWAPPSVLHTGDMNGDGTPDFVRFRRDDEKHAGQDVLVHLTYRAGDPDPDSDGLTNEEEAAAGSDALCRDSDNDGLLDGWEVKGFRGTDLKALGCSPNHADILVRVQRVADWDETRTRAEMERVRGYYASLPVTNRDGATGIALHPVLAPAIPVERANRGWWALGSEHFDEALRGVWHWMLVTNAGGGQSDMLADRGSAGGRALYATFIHEFGHQLGLPHEGFWPGGWCPAYPSLMNYAYSYQLGGKPEAIGYSTGKLAAIAFDERALSEKLPLRHEDVAFLAGPPYHWRLKAEGEHTLVDWNWNGVLGEEKVRADINYGYSTTAGHREILMPGRRFDEQDRTGHAPFLIPHRDRLYLFYVEAPKDAKADEQMSAEERRAARPISGPVMVRVRREQGPWSDPVPVGPQVFTGDPTAVVHEGRLTLFGPTETGIAALPLKENGLAPGAGTVLPGTQQADVSPVSWRGRLLLFLWRGADRAVSWATWDGRKLSEERELDFRSRAPVGACADPQTGELLLGAAVDQDERRSGRWQVRRYSLAPAAGAARDAVWELKPAGTRWVMGESGRAAGNRRPTLLFESGPQAGKNGRLHFIATGRVTENQRKSCYYNWMTIEDPSVNDGWLQRRYYDEWTESASAVAACWYRGDIALASRWYGVANREFRDNDVYVAYQGLGISAEQMGDHDDVGFIFRRGMAQSILYLQRR